MLCQSLTSSPSPSPLNLSYSSLLSPSHPLERQTTTLAPFPPYLSPPQYNPVTAPRDFVEINQNLLPTFLAMQRRLGRRGREGGREGRRKG